MYSKSLISLFGQKVCACDANTRDEEAGINHLSEGINKLSLLSSELCDMLCRAVAASHHKGGRHHRRCLVVFGAVCASVAQKRQRAGHEVYSCALLSFPLAAYTFSFPLAVHTLSFPSLLGIYEHTGLNTHNGTTLIKFLEWHVLCRA